MTEAAFDRGDKAPDAYRTISEVAHELGLPQHVLRFWESRFGQIRPLKRGGGRRYYKREDIALLKGIQHLLYNEGYTIKGVQKLLKSQGVRAIQALSGGAASAVQLIEDNNNEPEENVVEIRNETFSDFDDDFEAEDPIDTAEELAPLPYEERPAPEIALPLFHGQAPPAANDISQNALQSGSQLADFVIRLKAIREELLECRELLNKA